MSPPLYMLRASRSEIVTKAANTDDERNNHVYSQSVIALELYASRYNLVQLSARDYI
jgi:hypothetical protein